MQTITQKQFDEVIKKCRIIKENTGEYKSYFPSQKELLLMANNITHYYTYLIYLLANNIEPTDIRNIVSLNGIKRLIKLNTIFRDGYPECLEETIDGVVDPTPRETSGKLMDDDDGIDELLEVAIDNEQRRIARKMLKSGSLSVDAISTYTGLAEDIIREEKKALIHI